MQQIMINGYTFIYFCQFHKKIFFLKYIIDLVRYLEEGNLDVYFMMEQQYTECSQSRFSLRFNPIALRMAKTLWSFSHSECNRVKGPWYPKFHLQVLEHTCIKDIHVTV